MSYRFSNTSCGLCRQPKPLPTEIALSTSTPIATTTPADKALTLSIGITIKESDWRHLMASAQDNLCSDIVRLGGLSTYMSSMLSTTARQFFSSPQWKQDTFEYNMSTAPIDVTPLYSPGHVGEPYPVKVVAKPDDQVAYEIALEECGNGTPTPEPENPG